MSIYHVAKNGTPQGDGSMQNPFLTINAAAKQAQPGDCVQVHAGVYREWVDPPRGGASNTRRITYEAAPGEEVIIKGSEQITSWENLEGSVWKVQLPNRFFGHYNPFQEIIIGDWTLYPTDRNAHLGDVYLNGISLYEAGSLDEVKHPKERTQETEFWSGDTVLPRYPHRTKYLWFAQVDEETTTIYANFHGADPNRELTEINVRQCCFYPRQTGMNYITVRGFEMAHAATPWTPPTADQPGLIGPHWSRGWIIENNHIHDAKTSGISLGKEKSTGHNYRTFRMDKPGYQYQLESVFAARKIGWSKEKIGSHIVRGNRIHSCGQNGIVGHLGCVFSEIYDNHIYDIAIKREFYGHEIAGIKLHAAIDVQIHHNCIHHCTLGTWMDWQTQGTRISKNIFFENGRDLFIEVSHGPYLVDYNLLCSPYALDNYAQGGAYIHNLFGGKIVREKVLNRATPYHTPHSTEVAGYAMVYSADDRMHQNLFIGGIPQAVGSHNYDGCTTSLEEYMQKAKVEGYGDLNLYEAVEQPAQLAHNAYFNGAKKFERETECLYQPEESASFSIEESGGEVYLHCQLPAGFEAYTSPAHTTQSLGRVRIVDADFENPDGSPLRLDSDLLDCPVGEGSVPGPLGCLAGGANRVKIWG